VTRYYVDESVTLLHGDCLDVMRELPDNSVHAVCTDPPYDLTAGKKGGTGPASVNLSSPAGRARITVGFMGKSWDGTGIAFRPEVWAQCLRVLKPGGHLLAFGGTRTWHRLACAVEDAGFEVRDSIAWLYGSGFPKSLNVSKAIDKAAGAEREPSGAVTSLACEFVRRGVPCEGHLGETATSQSGLTVHALPTAPATDDARRWQGWGTAVKPAFEPIVVARKPLVGTVAQNVLAHGTGALNVDACRVAGLADRPGTTPPSTGERNSMSGDLPRQDYEPNAAGRWPANVVLDDTQAAELDRQSGTLTSGKVLPHHRDNGKLAGTLGAFAGASGRESYGDSGGASRFFPTFRYEPKAPTVERPRDGEVAHPTVKPLDLMRWLVRLVTPPGGAVLDPFAGSGTTAEACVIEGFRCVAIEREAAYLPLIVARLSKPIQPDLFGGVA
jgi:DNA modification methylase